MAAISAGRRPTASLCSARPVAAAATPGGTRPRGRLAGSRTAGADGSSPTESKRSSWARTSIQDASAAKSAAAPSAKWYLWADAAKLAALRAEYEDRWRGR